MYYFVKGMHVDPQVKNSSNGASNGSTDKNVGIHYFNDNESNSNNKCKQTQS